MRTLVESYQGKVDFYLIYMREAHPADGDWALGAKRLNEPKTYEERVSAAGGCQSALDLKVTTLVDEMDDRVARAYNAWPERMYVIDPQRVIRFKMEPGPMGFNPKKVRRFLEEYFGDF